MNSTECNVVVLGAGPYGLSTAAYLRSVAVEARVFGDPMGFWQQQMPAGMLLRSSWEASHIADPKQQFTLRQYSQTFQVEVPRRIPVEQFVDYGRWFQRKAVPHVENRKVKTVDRSDRGFRLAFEDGEEITARRVAIATGIGAFASRPAEFEGIPKELAAHATEQKDLASFKGQKVAVIGGGQSALESAALLKESGADVEVIARDEKLNWVGLHPKLHRLGPLSKMLYSNRDVGPAGISRLVAMPHVFRRFPRGFQDKTAYRAIRPAGAFWLLPRIQDIPIHMGLKVNAAKASNSRLHLRLSDGTERLVDHAILATGFRVDVSRYPFLSPSLVAQIKTVNGFPVLKRGLESSVRGLHFLGKPAAWSFGPLLGFVSGAEFASQEFLWGLARTNGNH